MRVPCFHVQTSNGETYGVAASGKIEAKLMVQDRLTSEGSTDSPVSATRMGTWGLEVPYGNVLHY